jgi:murein DD-endopeptidase MepM/ murein hydrolase activator NlpD
MRNVLLPVIAAVSLAATAALSPAADAPSLHASTRARAFVVQVIVPGRAGETDGLVDVRRGHEDGAGSYSVGTDGDLVSVSESTARADAVATGRNGGAEAVVSTGSVSLLGGLVTASSLRVRAAASSRPGSADGSGRADVRDLLVAGAPVDATPNGVVDLPDVGTLTIDETVETVRGETGRRGFVTALHLRITTDTASYPRGTEVLVGYADAGAASPKPAPKPAARPRPAAVAPATPPVAAALPGEGASLGHDSDTEAPPPGGFVLDPPIAAAVRARLLSGEYVFPVVGGAGFSDDFGGPRADTGFHQGIDLFAANGTPLVAVHDGTLFRVGWNRLGGNRLWLDDGHGNLFYYAHLSGYADVARDGAQVRAGDVIGFMGHSGDAMTTPYHLHFEIHPGGGWAVPPIAYVRAWQGAIAGVTARRPATRVVVAPADDVPQGATLTQAVDIAGVSGLDDAALTGVVGSIERGAGAPAPDPLVAVAGDAAPGFAP